MFHSIWMIHDIVLPIDAPHILCEGINFILAGILLKKLFKRVCCGTIKDPFVGCKKSKLSIQIYLLGYLTSYFLHILWVFFGSKYPSEVVKCLCGIFCLVFIGELVGLLSWMECNLCWACALFVWEHVLIFGHVVKEVSPLKRILGACATRGDKEIVFASWFSMRFHQVGDWEKHLFDNIINWYDIHKSILFARYLGQDAMANQ